MALRTVGKHSFFDLALMKLESRAVFFDEYLDRPGLRHSRAV
jgi:hypothetical protein